MKNPGKLLLLLAALSGLSTTSIAAETHDRRAPTRHQEVCMATVSGSDSTLWQCDRLQILQVKGSPGKRARLIGEMVRDGHLSDETLRYFGNSIESKTAGLSDFLKDLILRIYAYWSKPRRLLTPNHLLDELHAFADASGESWSMVQNSVTIADLGVFLSGMAEITYDYLPSFGCTSSARRYDDGSFVLGRNLDFSGVHVWDKNPLVVVHLPEEGSGELKHIAFSSSPLFFASITGVNEKGIAFLVHQNFTRDVFGNGAPLYGIGEAVLRQARTLDEAVELIRQYRPGPVWTFILADLNQGEVRTVEASAHHFAVRRSDAPIFAQTNHMLTDFGKDVEKISFSALQNSKFRYDKAIELMEASQSETAVDDMAMLLGYQEHPEGEASLHRDILKPHTIQSVIFHRPARNSSLRALVAMDAAPTAAGRYFEFRLQDFWELGIGETIQGQVLTPFDPGEKRRVNQQLVAEAYKAFFEHHDYAKTIELLSGQTSPGASLIRAVSSFKLKRYEAALTEADQALTRLESASDLAMLRSLRSVRLLSMSKLKRPRKELKKEAEALLALDPPNPKMRLMAEHLVKRGFFDLRDKMIGFDWFGGDLRWSLGY